jgi:hypothetical protein
MPVSTNIDNKLEKIEKRQLNLDSEGFIRFNSILKRSTPANLPPVQAII